MEPVRDAHLRRLYHPVGEITVLWEMLDHFIHYTGFAMIKVLGTTPEDHRGWPVMMGARLSMIDKLFRRKEFVGLQSKWKGIYKSIRHLQDLRDYLVHGAATRYDPKKDAIMFARVDRATAKQLKREPDFTHSRTQMLVRFAMLERAVKQCEKATKELEQLRQDIRALNS